MVTHGHMSRQNAEGRRGGGTEGRRGVADLSVFRRVNVDSRARGATGFGAGGTVRIVASVAVSPCSMGVSLMLSSLLSSSLLSSSSSMMLASLPEAAASTFSKQPGVT